MWVVSMRRRAGIFIVVVLVVAILAAAGTACLADSASVTVQVTVPRLIHVSGDAVGHPNINVVRLDSAGSVTYVAP